MLFYGIKKNKIIQKFNIELPYNFGENIKMPHRNVIINENAVIGNNCTFHGFNVVGNNEKDNEVPIIGNNVDVGVGSIIVGYIYIADGCKIGANSFVNKSCYKKGSVLIESSARIKDSQLIGGIYDTIKRRLLLLFRV